MAAVATSRSRRQLPSLYTLLLLLLQRLVVECVCTSPNPFCSQHSNLSDLLCLLIITSAWMSSLATSVMSQNHRHSSDINSLPKHLQDPFEIRLIALQVLAFQLKHVNACLAHSRRWQQRTFTLNCNNISKSDIQNSTSEKVHYRSKHNSGGFTLHLQLTLQ